MGNFGFSYIGFLFLAMLIIPNILWTRHQPEGYEAKNENKFLQICERIGQALVSCTALVFSDFNLRPWSLWTFWLIGATLLMLMYEGWWIRYFRSRKTLTDFYSSLWGVPVAGATLPVAAFLLLGIYGKVIWLIIAVIILGLGHIGIHLQHRREIKAL